MLSGHIIVLANLRMFSPCPPDKIVSYRKYSASNMDDFCDELAESQLIRDSSDTLAALVDQYNGGLQRLFDKHVPVKTKTFVQRTTVPLYSQTTQQAKRDGRQQIPKEAWNWSG